MIIPIKQALLEGYTLEAIVEAVHANHPHLNKSRFKDKNLTYSAGKEIEKNRSALADNIKRMRSSRDNARKEDTTMVKSFLLTSPELKEIKNRDANFKDNEARAKSQTGGFGSANELKHFDDQKYMRIMRNVPRIISSAKE